MHAELPIGAFVCAFLVLVPLPWHWRARNVPTLSIVVWLFVSNLIFGINAIIWAGNVRMVVPIWCDIVTKIQIGATMALPACCLCLCIHLERIASVRHVLTTRIQKRNRMLFDLLMCWGLPMTYMALHYIVQGHRFDIVEDFGCRPAIFTSIQSILIIWTLPLLVVILTFIYAGVALLHFFKRRIMFSRHLQDSNSALTPSRYFRLMAMAIVQMFWGVLTISINMWFTCRNGLRPWTDWNDVHSNFSRVAIFPTAHIPSYVLRWTNYTWWTIPISSVLFFVFFSFGEDAIKEYKACADWLARVILRRTQASNQKSTSKLLPLSFPSRVALPKTSNADLSNDTTSDFQSYCSSDLSKDALKTLGHSSYAMTFAVSTIDGHPHTSDSDSTFITPSTLSISKPPDYVHPGNTV